MLLKPINIALPKDIERERPKGIQATDLRQGMTTWRNPVNKYFVCELHYSVDPRKRTKEWKADAQAGIPYAEWMREYEIQWSSFEGVPVYAEHYDKEFHVSSEPLVWSMEYSVIRGWDFGLDTLGMACVFAQLVSNSRLLVYRELLASDSDIYTFTEAVKRYSLEWFPGALRFFDIVDPSGFNRNAAAKDKRSYCDTVREVLRARPVPGEKIRAKRLKSVVDWLDGSIKGQPKMLIDGVGCPVLVEGFDGGYHYAYAKDGQVKDEPEKNQHSHVHDALQMVCTRIEQLNLAETEVLAPSSPKYNFGKVA